MKKSADVKKANSPDTKTELKKGTLFQKMLDDKKAVSEYFQGKETLESINAKGIKFVKPI